MLVAEASTASCKPPPLPGKSFFFFLLLSFLPPKQLIPVHERSPELRKATLSLSLSPFLTMQSKKGSGSRTLCGRNRH